MTNWFQSRGAGPRMWIALGAIYVIWGSTYLAIRLMVETMPALLGAGVRFLLAGALLYAWVGWRSGSWRVEPRQLAAAGLVGVLLCFGGNGLVTVAEQDVPSSLAALLIASEPMWVILLRALFRERPARATLLGVAVGFAGVGVLLWPGHGPKGVALGAMLLVIVAAISWASGSFASSRLRMPEDPMRSTAMQMLVGGAVMVPVAGAFGEFGSVDVGSFSARSLGAFVYLIFIGSIVAFTAYAWLLQNVPITTVSTYAYVNPVIAVFLGWVVLSEPLSAMTLIGAAVIVSSVAAIVRWEGRGTPDAARAPAPTAAEEVPARPRAAA